MMSLMAVAIRSWAVEGGVLESFIHYIKGHILRALRTSENPGCQY
jgi:hypothetical protein